MRKICIAWDIHYKCNYKCPYCWFFEELNKITLSKKHISNAEQWLSAWRNFFDRYKDIHIEITGGEPFIYSKFVELVGELSKKATIRITSNLSVSVDFINNFIKMIDSNRVKVAASFHPLFTKLNIFLEKTLFLKIHGFLEVVVFVAYPPQIKQIECIEKEFKERGINFTVTPFWGRYKGADYPLSYSEEEKELLMPYLGNDIKRLKFTLDKVSPKGKLCHAGQWFALLVEDGTVFRCGQLKNKSIGNFFDNDFTLVSSPLPCESDVCPCDDHNYLEEA